MFNLEIDVKILAGGSWDVCQTLAVFVAYSYDTTHQAATKWAVDKSSSVYVLNKPFVAVVYTLHNNHLVYILTRK